MLIGLCLLLAYNRVHGPWASDQAQVQGALTVHGGWLQTVIPLLAGVVGGSLADERRKGIALTFLARGVTRGKYLLSKLLGAAASGALITAAAIGGFYVLVGILWPAGRVHTEHQLGDQGPVPALYAVNPLANDMLLAAMLMAAAAALSMVSVLAGTLTTSRYIAMAAPFLFFILCVAIHEYGGNRLLNPYTYLDLPTFYPLTFQASWRPYAAFLYWTGFAVVLAALARWIFARRELS